MHPAGPPRCTVAVSRTAVRGLAGVDRLVDVAPLILCESRACNSEAVSGFLLASLSFLMVVSMFFRWTGG